MWIFFSDIFKFLSRSSHFSTRHDAEHATLTKNESTDVFPNIDRTQAAPSTIYCNALHAADETIQSLPGVMGVHSEFFVLVTLTFDL